MIKKTRLYHNYSFKALIRLFIIDNILKLLLPVLDLVLASPSSTKYLSTFEFLNEHSEITQHVLLLSLTSAIGQIFIFLTIQNFGALVFSLIMTTRQVVSIILSSLIFQHFLSYQSVFGIFIIFLALFLQQYIKLKSEPKKTLNRLTSSEQERTT